MTRRGYAWEMSDTPPSDPDYINHNRLAALMRAFDFAVTGRQQAHVMGEEFRTVNPAEQIEALKQIEINGEPTIVYVPRQKNPRRRLSTFSMFRYIRDSIRLRRYNREWIKNNIPGN